MPDLKGLDGEYTEFFTGEKDNHSIKCKTYT